MQLILDLVLEWLVLVIVAGSIASSEAVSPAVGTLAAPSPGLSHGAALAGASQCSAVSSGCVSGHIPAGDTEDVVAASAALDELRPAMCILGFCSFWSWSVQSPPWGRSCPQAGGSLGCQCHTLHCSEPVGSPGSVK